MERWVRWDAAEVLRKRRFAFIGFSNLVSCGVPVECPAGIAYGISLLESCIRWLAVAESYRFLISR